MYTGAYRNSKLRATAFFGANVSAMNACTSPKPVLTS